MTTNTAKQPTTGFFHSKRGRDLIENLTAYFFLLPALLIIFIFGIFPVALAFVVSLHDWERFPEDWYGLDHYVDAIGNLAYVGFFWVAISILVYGIYRIWQLYKDVSEHREAKSLTLIFPGMAWALTIVAIVHWLYRLIVEIYKIPQELRGSNATLDRFIEALGGSFSIPIVADSAFVMNVFIAASIVWTIGFIYLLKPKRSQHYILVVVGVITSLVAGTWLLYITLEEINLAITTAEETLPIWSQIIMISAGAGLLGVALWLWNHSVNDHGSTNQMYVLRLLAVVVAVVGAVFLMRELPMAVTDAHINVKRGFSNTVWYAVVSVPFQLILGMLLAVLLFRKIRFKSFFRIVFFMPYITPFVATSVVFSLLFSPNPSSLVNQIVSFIGIPEQIWLQEPKGIIRLIFGEGVPPNLAGPSLALLVIIFYNIWVYAGFSSVIFLAGLGNIPEDVYEAAEIDGANGWHQFRYITIPLLSPTTFFLVLIATIGTFQAFTQILLMRKLGAYDAVNTINMYIFDEIQSTSRNFDYGAAMAFVLFAVILVLTAVQNRVAQRRVFYG